LPAWFTKLNPRYGTPVRSVVVIVLISAVASILASVGTGREEAFQLLQTSNQISFGLYYCAMFAVPLAVGARFGRRPGFWLKISAVLGLTVTVVQVVLATVPIIEVNNTWSFAGKVIATAIVANLVGLAIYWRGRRIGGASQVLESL
jgi:amino acid transporter